MVVNSRGIYSKHYYAGSQRIVSRIGDNAMLTFDNYEPVSYTEAQNEIEQEANNYFIKFNDNGGFFVAKLYKPDYDSSSVIAK